MTFKFFLSYDCCLHCDARNTCDQLLDPGVKDTLGLDENVEFFNPSSYFRQLRCTLAAFMVVYASRRVMLGLARSLMGIVSKVGSA